MDTVLMRFLEGQTVVGKYYLDDLIGKGDFGGVFRASHQLQEGMPSNIVVKIISVGSEKDKLKQLEGLALVSRLKHSHILQSYDAGLCQLQIDNQPVALLYVVMEEAEDTLKKRLQRGVMTGEEAREAVQQIASALDYLHHSDDTIVHCNLKPSNVLLVGGQWKLTDFGLLQGELSTVVNNHPVMGTGVYTPSEAYSGEVSPAGDMWALGVIVQEMLTNTVNAATSTDLPTPFNEIICGCLIKAPEQRLTAQQVMDAWSAAPATAVSSTSDTESGVAQPQQENADDEFNAGMAEYEQDNYTEAMQWFQKAADRGDADAMYHISAMFHNGEGVTQDYAEAMRWCKKAADKGNVYAMFGIGRMFHNGEGVTRDYNEAMRWYQRAADKDDVDAMYTIGALYHNGDGVTRDYAEAMRWYKKAADEGCDDAMRVIGLMYEYGEGVPKNLQEAEMWYQQSGGMPDSY